MKGCLFTLKRSVLREFQSIRKKGNEFPLLIFVCLTCRSCLKNSIFGGPKIRLIFVWILSTRVLYTRRCAERGIWNEHLAYKICPMMTKQASLRVGAAALLLLQEMTFNTFLFIKRLAMASN